MKRRNPPLTDRERILLTLVHRMSRHAFRPPDPARLTEREHVAYYDENPKPGDLVLGATGPIDQFKVAWYVKKLGYSDHLVREIGSDRVCKYVNEAFHPIRGFPSTMLLEGNQYKFYRKVKRAFLDGHGIPGLKSYYHLLGDLTFDGDKATIWVREKWGGGFEKESKPYPVIMTWSRKTKVSEILDALLAGGFGTREFEWVPRAPRA